MTRNSALWAELGLQVDGNGRPHPNAANAVRILRAEPYAGRVWFDDFFQRVRTDIDGLRHWTDADDAALLLHIQSEAGIPKMSMEAVRQAVVHVAYGDRRREPAIWLSNFLWDKQPRLNRLMVRGFGCLDGDYHVACGEVLMLSCVARALRPGCKVDHIIVLEGAQGIGKSTALEILGGEWYGATHSSIGSTDLLLELMGKLLVELPELESLSKREAETAKAFASRRVDTFRAPYARNVVDIPRGCILVGTTNESSYLKDATGGRRFLPVRCGQIDLDWIRLNRAQLFAEAAERVRRGEAWWHVPRDEAADEQEQRFQSDPWEEPIEQFLIGRTVVSISQVLGEGLKIEIGRRDKAGQMRAARILERAGWKRVTRMQGTHRRRVWISPAEGGAGGDNVVPLVSQENHDDALPVPPVPLKRKSNDE